MRFWRKIILGVTIWMLLCYIILLRTGQLDKFFKRAMQHRTLSNILNEDVYNLTKKKNINENYSSRWIHSPSKACRHVAFLKVHKAASSTAQNIFLRYGYQRNLTFVLPVITKFNYPNVISIWGTINEKNIVPPPTNKSFDILCCHVNYNREAFRSIMPSDTVYIGIVREPLEHLKSTLQYFRPPEVFKIKDSNPISKFLSNPRFYTSNRTSSFVNNRMAFEYNFPNSVFLTKNSADITNYLQKLESEFSLVIVVEYFDESVVLMRRILHWDIKDILYIKNNQSPKKNAPKLTLKDKQRHRQWAVLEYALYDFFFKRLWDQIKKEGADFYEELLFFKYLRREVTDFCIGVKNKKEYVVEKTKWNKKFTVTDYDCDLILKGEMKFVQTIRKKQYGNT